MKFFCVAKLEVMAFIQQNGVWLSWSSSLGAMVASTTPDADSFIHSIANGDVTLASLGGSVRITSHADVLVHNAAVTLAARDTIPETTADVVHGAGILAGRASGTCERSIRWSRGYAELPDNNTDEVMMAGARSNVGSWDVRGGGLRIMAETSNMEVAYGFCINKSTELEIYRREINFAHGSNPIYRRVGCFGSKISPDTVTTPVVDIDDPNPDNNESNAIAIPSISFSLIPTSPMI
jgi:hypothetical protein